jgi:peptidoglycan/LPS O-acetylase OafA/YrhL
MTAVLVVLMIGAVVLVTGTPGYVIARRRGMRQPWLAYIPIFALGVVLFESMGRSGVPVVGFLVPIVSVVLGLWIAIEMPIKHSRSSWWTLALLVPLVGLYGYALTMARQSEPQLGVAAA